ncbi:hypothetical protein [Actinomadura harenae]|uniref:Uncharacterized protein n=1 Tax=Actinomadura harenae TaxID=2483351 RepID=A0A3M2M493_9ACTN|nr:hypothetical protein [Actinomadura harenae]RMI44517.1 hypothetical protein EBO15_12820 [Actinomadura harenae]
MSVLPALLTNATILAAATGLTYAVTMFSVALVSVASRSPARRRDARATLALLVRRGPDRDQHFRRPKSRNPTSRASKPEGRKTF